MYFAIIRVDSACQIRLFSRLQAQSIGTEDHGLYGEFGRLLGVLSLWFEVRGAGEYCKDGEQDAQDGEVFLHGLSLLVCTTKRG